MTPQPAADAVIFVLVDACRHDYLGRTRFLKQLAARSLVGQLEEPFGFCPRGAYFGGLSMAEQGYTHLFHYDPRGSAFRWTRDASGTGEDEALGRRLHDEVIGRARTALPAFSAAAVNPWGIPLEWQCYFDFSEREAPWSPRAGYRSLFHRLDDAGMPWLEVSWPFLGIGTTADDGIVAGEALRRLNETHRFAFIHLPSLDALGHQCGPGSREVQTAIGEADRLCELIHARALEIYRDPVLLFAGDHGMIPIVRSTNPAAALLATKLRFGHDLAFFIDSTMVRCWFFTQTARRRTMAALDEVGGGHWIDDEEKTRWHIDGIDSKNGDEYFLADPGVLFSPNFFDWSGNYPPRGMHGYAPEVADNRALFLAHRPQHPETGDVGVVEARRLYPTFLNWLGWDAGDVTPLAPVSAPENCAGRSRWFVTADQATDALVDAHLARTVDAVRNRAPHANAVVLVGGFGRGEGTPTGLGPAARPANDYDLLVVGIEGHETAGLGDELAREFRIDFVDIAGGRTLTPPAPPRLCDFDLRYGAEVLWGDPAIVERLGTLAPADLDVVEAAFLMGNRTGGMLLGLTGEKAASGDEAAYLARQTSKFLIAIADAWLIVVGDYNVSYAVRQRRFRDLARSAGFSIETIAAVDRAYDAKLGRSAGRKPFSVPLSTAVGALNELETILSWRGPAEAGHYVRDPPALEQAVQRHIHTAAAWHQRAAELGLDPVSFDRFWPAAGAAVYGAIHDILQAWPDGPAAQGEAARAALSDCFTGISGIADVDMAHTVARLWLGFFH